MTQEGCPSRLREECDKALADVSFAPKDGNTFCNVALVSILRGLGVDICPDKPAPLANDIHELLSRLTGWVKIRPEMAQGFALGGCIVVASKKGLPHGHVAILYPSSIKVYSGKWGKRVPICCNIGSTTGIMGVNFAFAKEPEYFLYSA